MPSADSLEYRLAPVMTQRFANREPVGKRKVRVFWNDARSGISHYANMAKKVFKQEHFLKEWREARGFTQESLANELGTSKSVISELESSKKGLSNKWLTRIAPVLKTTRGLILDFHPDWVDMDMLEHFLGVEDGDRPQAIKILKTFKKRA